MFVQQNSEIAELNLQSAKKQSNPSILKSLEEDKFFLSNNASLKDTQSKQLSFLPKDIKIQQIQTMYDSYNLLKYGNVLLTRKISGSENKKEKQMKNQSLESKGKDKNSQTFKNTKLKTKQLIQMKSRLTSIQQNRKVLINQIGKYVPK